MSKRKPIIKIDDDKNVIISINIGKIKYKSEECDVQEENERRIEFIRRVKILVEEYIESLEKEILEHMQCSNVYTTGYNILLDKKKIDMFCYETTLSFLDLDDTDKYVLFFGSTTDNSESLRKFLEEKDRISMIRYILRIAICRQYIARHSFPGFINDAVKMAL